MIYGFVTHIHIYNIICEYSCPYIITLVGGGREDDELCMRIPKSQKIAFCVFVVNVFVADAKTTENCVDSFVSLSLSLPKENQKSYPNLHENCVCCAVTIADLFNAHFIRSLFVSSCVRVCVGACVRQPRKRTPSPSLLSSSHESICTTTHYSSSTTSDEYIFESVCSRQRRRLAEILREDDDGASFL